MIAIKRTSITVRDIQVFARHGVSTQEKTVGNEFLVSVCLDFDAAGAMRYDDLYLTVNYAKIIGIVRDVMSQPSDLIENVTWRIANALLESFTVVTSGTVAVTKVHPPVSTLTGGATFTFEFSRK